MRASSRLFHPDPSGPSWSETPPGHDHGHDHGHDLGHGPGHHHHHGGQREPVHFSDPAQESLSQALRAGFNVLRLIILVLLVAYVGSGWFQVGPGEQGLIVRFGELRENPRTGTPIFGEGWHFALPDPFDEKIPIRADLREMELDTFLFQRSDEQKRRDAGKSLAETVPNKSELEPGQDGAMLSGDRNLSHGLWEIVYRVEDGSKFVRNVGERIEDADLLLRRLAENAIVREVAGRRVEELLKIGTRADENTLLVGDAVRRRLSESLARLETGIVVTQVRPDTIEPGRTQAAFRNVSVAENERNKLVAEARSEEKSLLNQAAGAGYERLLEAIDAYGAAQLAGEDESVLAGLLARIDAELLRAEGEVAQILSRAESLATAQREQIRSEFEEFLTEREAYRRDPDRTVVRNWVRMRDAVLGSRDNEIFFVPGSHWIEIFTNRDPVRQIEAEQERMRRRFEQPNQP